MKEIAPGYQVRLEVVVTPEMTVNFDQLGPGHPVYSTYNMAKHFEEAGRMLLLPHLDDGEEGLGVRVVVDHVESALVGMKVTICASFERQEKRRLHARLEAHNELGDLIGSGYTVQYVTYKYRILDRFSRMQARWEESKAKGEKVEAGR
jgi:predicted thioesterase